MQPLAPASAPPPLRRVGFIGLGVMGGPMARNLLRAGFDLMVFDLHAARMELLTAEGARPAHRPSEAASGADAVITMLPDSPQVREVMLGPGGVLEAAASGSLVIDMSSVLPSLSREIAGAGKQLGIDILDAPVSGGEAGAKAATLSIMAGGDERAFERALPLFRALGSSVVRVGPPGAGSAAKLASQMIAGVTLAAISEAFTFASRAGVDPQVLFEAIRHGFAGSAMLEAKAPKILTRDFQPSFRLALLLKDLANACTAASCTGAIVPLTKAVAAALQMVAQQGQGDLDCCAVVRYFENQERT